MYAIDMPENDDMAGFIDDILFKGDRLTSEHKLGVVLSLT